MAFEYGIYWCVNEVNPFVGMKVILPRPMKLPHDLSWQMSALKNSVSYASIRISLRTNSMFKNVLLLTKHVSLKMVKIFELNFLVEQILHDLHQSYCKNPKRHWKYKFIGHFSIHGNYLVPILLSISAMYIFRLILERVLKVARWHWVKIFSPDSGDSVWRDLFTYFF